MDLIELGRGLGVDLPAVIVIATATLAVIYVVWWIRFVPATAEERAQWAAQKEARRLAAEAEREKQRTATAAREDAVQAAAAAAERDYAQKGGQ